MPIIGEIRNHKELGRPSDVRYIWVACQDCGKERWVQYVKKKPVNDLCFSCCRKGELSHFWKGGDKLYLGYKKVIINKNSPFYSMADDEGYVLEHRLVMAQSLGRPLTKEELVHHINGIRIDNRLENLTLTNRAEHASIHHKNMKRGVIFST